MLWAVQSRLSSENPKGLSVGISKLRRKEGRQVGLQLGEIQVALVPSLVCGPQCRRQRPYAANSVGCQLNQFSCRVEIERSISSGTSLKCGGL